MSTKHEMRIGDLEEEITSLKEQLAEREWVSVEDELPRSGDYLVVADVSFGIGDKIYQAMVAGYEDMDERWLIDEPVTHWMPLPSPPTGEENEWVD